MKKIKVLISLLVVLSMTIGFTLSLKSNQNVLSNTQSSVIDEVSKSVEKWVQVRESPFYKNISVKSVLIESNIQPGSLSEVIFNVNEQQTLKAQSPEELPMIKGMINCLNSKKPNLKQSQIDYANRQLEDQLKELRGYINEVEEWNETIKVTFNTDSNCNIKPDSINLYVADNPFGGNSFVDADTCKLETAEEMEQRGYKDMEEIINKSGKDNSPCVALTLVDVYDRVKAGDYADKWTSELASDVDKSKWKVGKPTNPSDDPENDGEFKFSLNIQQDCADYVSQALYKGGIPMDIYTGISYWRCERYTMTTPVNGSPWVYVPKLESYMINNHYFEQSNFDLANKGSVIVFHCYQDANYVWHPTTDGQHVVMITLNNTVTRTFSAHNTDRKKHPYHSYDGWVPYSKFYKVHFYVNGGYY